MKKTMSMSLQKKLVRPIEGEVLPISDLWRPLVHDEAATVDRDCILEEDVHNKRR